VDRHAHWAVFSARAIIHHASHELRAVGENSDQLGLRAVKPWARGKELREPRHLYVSSAAFKQTHESGVIILVRPSAYGIVRSSPRGFQKLIFPDIDRGRAALQRSGSLSG